MDQTASVTLPLRNPAFRRLWLGLSISYLGDQFTVIALLWFVLQLTGSGAAVGLVILCFDLPGVATGAILGRMLDRYQPRLVMGLDNLARAALIAAIPTLHELGSLQLWHIAVLASLAGALSPATSAGVRAFVPHVVDDDELDRANALTAASQQFSYLVGPVTAGFAVARFGGPRALFIDAASFLLMGLLVLTLPTITREPQHTQGMDKSTSPLRPDLYPPRERSVNVVLLSHAVGEAGRGQKRGSTEGAWQRGTYGPRLYSSLRRMLGSTTPRRLTDTSSSGKGFGGGAWLGFGVLFRLRYVPALTLLSLVFFFSYGPLEAALPVYSAQTLHADASGYGLLWTGFGVGAFAGVLTLTKLSRRWRPGIALPMIAVLWGALLCPLFFIRQRSLAMVLLGLAGASWAPYTPMETSLLQRLVPTEVRGQVFGARHSLVAAAAPLGAALGGLMLHSLSAPLVIALSGLACILAGLGGLVSPALRQLK